MLLSVVSNCLPIVACCWSINIFEVKNATDLSKQQNCPQKKMFRKRVVKSINFESKESYKVFAVSLQKYYCQSRDHHQNPLVSFRYRLLLLQQAEGHFLLLIGCLFKMSPAKQGLSSLLQGLLSPSFIPVLIIHRLDSALDYEVGY